LLGIEKPRVIPGLFVMLMLVANRAFFSKVASGMFNSRINAENHNFLYRGTTLDKTITITMAGW
jgi:hypothetical protein